MSKIKTGTTATTGFTVDPDTTGNLIVQTGAADTTAMIVDNAKNVAIGSSSPTVSLDASSKTDAIRIPVGTTAQRPTAPVGGMIRYNTTLGYIENYFDDTATWEKTSPIAGGICSGGTESSYVLNGVTYKVHTFTSSGTLTITGKSRFVEYLIVGGGGGGGLCWAGGGGGGGFLSSSTTLTVGTYNIFVGAGGTAVTAGSGSAGGNGTDSSGFGFTATGGGGGGGNCGSANANGGGSGGGGSNGLAGGAGTVGQGNAGGAGSNAGDHRGGGGGGAGAVGGTANGLTGGAGGIGKSNAFQTGTAQWYSGGGGGQGNGIGGQGGGTDGQHGAVVTPTPSPANTGGGGGGCLSTTVGGVQTQSRAGGSGIVVVRYKLIV